MVPAEVGFDLVRRDLMAAPFNYDLNTALELGARLFFLGAAPVTNWYQCVAGTAGCPATSGYMNLLAADDDNGNLADGTPHMTAIFAAFNRHGIACATPTVQNAGCATGPSAAPALAVTPIDQGARLTWSAVANAARYDVYQTDGVNGAAFGKVRIGTVAAAGPLAFEAANLLNGHTYHFGVIPVGTTESCVGRMSNMVTIAPTAGPNLGVRPTVTVAVTGGDGDGILDNCEIASLGVTVENTGTGTLTNVRIVGVTPLTHPSSVVVTPLPATFAASLADCASATGTVDVRALGMSFNQTTQFRIDVTADQLGGAIRSVVATISGVESDWQNVPTQTFSFETAGNLEGWQVVQGTWTQATVNGGANGTVRYLRSSTALDNACDVIRSPRIRTTATTALSLNTFFTIENISGGIWYDRANVGVVDATTGVGAVRSPGTGRLYNASGGAGGCNGTQPGWAGTAASWAVSGWSTANLNTPAGSVVNLEVRYATDGVLSLDGFRFDEVTLTNFDRQVPDAQPDTCCAAITVNPATIPAGTAGSVYSQTFTQTGGVGTIAWSVTGTLPTGLGLNTSTGVLSGTPTQTGSFPITVTATGSGGCTGSRGYALVINCQGVTVNPATIPAGTAGTAYSQTFTQTGGIGAITWSVTGALPAGVTLNPSTGVLSGTPTQTGSFPITVRATDANSCFGTRSVTLVINCQAIVVGPPALPNGTAGSPYSQAITQAGGIGTIVWSFTGTLPGGLALDPVTGVLSGTPTEHGTFNVAIRATDANGCFGEIGYVLVIDRAGPFEPAALAVDTPGNRVFEPGETVEMAPSWRNDTGAAEILAGAATGFVGPPGGTYDIVDGIADYGPVAPGDTASCTDCYSLSVAQPGARPVQHWDTTITETLSSTDARQWTLHIGSTFTDVPISNGFYRFVETMVHRNVTGGCAASTYCPASSTSRDQMAVFVLVSREAPGYLPPPCGATPMFLDVPVTSGFCRWVEELARRGVVGGCGGGNYCPANPATREQMAVFVLRTLDPTLTPPPCGAPMFADVPASSAFCPWIEELARRGVVTGCGGGNYCPTASVTREQMSVFLTVTFGLTLYGL
jgi:hypothetical protein